MCKRMQDAVQRALTLAQTEVESGGLPFSAVIVDQAGQIIGEGVNQVVAQYDCTAHAEVQAIRMAAQQLKQVSLSGVTLIASAEPCAFCYLAIKLAKIPRVIILADRDESSLHGFDYRWTYQLLREPQLQLTVSKWTAQQNRLAPFQLATTDLSSSAM